MDVVICLRAWHHCSSWFYAFLQALCPKFGAKISGIYLQIYSGTEPSLWIDTLTNPPYNIPDSLVKAVIRPVLMGSGYCPSSLELQFETYSDLNLTGGGLWLYDSMRKQGNNPCNGSKMPTTKEYANAIGAVCSDSSGSK